LVKCFCILLVNVGSFNETDDERGLAHFLEHMMFNGSENFPPGELVKYFQKIGMRFGNDANASTGFFKTVYDLHLPAGDAETLKEGLIVMKDYAGGALLLEDEIKREKGVVLAEKRTRDSAAYRTIEKSLQFELAGSRLANRLPIGLESVIESLNQDVVKGFYDAWYRPENMTLVAVGDFDKAAVVPLIKEALEGIASSAEARPDPPPGNVGHKGVKVFYHYEKEAGNARVSVETLHQIPEPRDSEAYKKERFLRDMAFEILNHRLDGIRAGDDPPFTSASGSSGQVIRYFHYAAIAADCAPDKWEQTLSILEQERRRIVKYGFIPDEVERVKKEVLAQLDKAVSQAATRESGSLARQIISSLSKKRVFQSPEQRRELLAPVAKSMTPAMLHGAFVDAWGPEPFGMALSDETKSNRQVLITGNAAIAWADKESAEPLILSVYNEARHTTVAKP